MADWLRLRLRWRSTLWYLIAVVLVMSIAATLHAVQATGMFRGQLEAGMMQQAESAGRYQALIDAWALGGDSVAPILRQVEALTGAEVAAFLPDGTLLATSRPNGGTLEDQLGGREMRSALGGSVASNRSKGPVGEPVFVVAAPVLDGGATLGAIQLDYPVSGIDASVKQFRNWLILVFAVSTAAIMAVLIVQMERTSRSMRKLTEMIERIAQGDLGARVLSLHRGEVGRLAMSLNRMADRLQSQSRKRAREKDRLNTVLYTMTDGIIILNRRGEVRMLNPAAAQILDVSRSKARRRSFVQVAREHRIAAVWTRCLESGAEQAEVLELANDVIVRVIITPFLKRRARGYLVMIQDLTQLRHLQTVRQDFVSNVSHELRTPLASLKALVETLRDGALEDPPAASRFLDRMEVEVDAMTQMVQELLELSRIESAQVPLRLEPVSPRDMILPAVERLRAQAERAGVGLVEDLDEPLPAVLADGERVQQVVTNLVHNAIKFTLSGGSVLVRAHQDGDFVCITVRDTGIGISREELQRVFERFYKTDRSRAYGGTGLGLSIASHIVQAHGGEMWAESAEDEWSLFGFSLPIAERSPTSTDSDTSASSSGVLPASTPSESPGVTL